MGEREGSPTLPDERPPQSGVYPIGIYRRRRPVVLLDGVDDALAAEYRAEADAILASGRLAELEYDFIGEASRIVDSGQLDECTEVAS